MGPVVSRERQMVKAAAAGNIEKVKKMISFGCFVNYNNCEALTAAAAAGQKDIILLMFDYGAHPESHVWSKSTISATF
jgi:hypothetical protein